MIKKHVAVYNNKGLSTKHVWLMRENLKSYRTVRLWGPFAFLLGIDWNLGTQFIYEKICLMKHPYTDFVVFHPKINFGTYLTSCMDINYSSIYLDTFWRWFAYTFKCQHLENDKCSLIPKLSFYSRYPLFDNTRVIYCNFPF